MPFGRGMLRAIFGKVFVQFVPHVAQCRRQVPERAVMVITLRGTGTGFQPLQRAAQLPVFFPGHAGGIAFGHGVPIESVSS